MAQKRRIKILDPMVLLIGNGPSVLEKKIGKKLDEFPEVYRFGSYPPGQYEDQVGSRVHGWVLNDSQTMTPTARQGAQIVRVSIASMRSRHVKETPVIAREVRGFQGTWPSSGLAVAMHFVRNCKMRVYFHGMDCYQPGGRKNYWSEELISPTDPHNSEEERRMWEQLEAEDLARRIQ